ncbi:triose-phosphate isomerase [Paracholeplasma manati]|jgi:triosephosphate isomerase|uniref:Triosephosphate isomerase n=1 Tax=Paracholeplasma manati TaxID=591373 RepID=A0ABT2Y9U6_9MOLU|nr:triose-phosphate isomerase [Paracholeplasma manati]MCV2232800.1 triose-phosphate isomerase [Paracholeplasma manati]MDG0888703.1 triose-phosphate isomerase [Paracholeplasma manati]MDX9807909.1 triose-phosphate isomerase [Acholeplasma sp.]
MNNLRRPVIAGNWKMYKTRDEALQFIYAVNQEVPNREVVESVVCANDVFLRDLVKRQGENIKIGAQNMHYAENGAFTGETSPLMLETTGVEYVIIGHSERRAMFNESDETVNLKVHAAIKHELTPIICVGESLEIREAGTTDAVVKNQVVKAYLNIDRHQALKTIVAYEPIWAIGTGKTATPEQAEETIKNIRGVLKELYGEDVSSRVRILYGGSVNTKNVDSLLAQENIDGALVGGASLDAASYLTLVNAAKK